LLGISFVVLLGILLGIILGYKYLKAL